MPAPENQQQGIEAFSAISSAFSSFWAWLIPMVAGIFHIGKVQQKITNIEAEHVEMKALARKTEMHLEKLSAYVEMLMQERNLPRN